MGVYLNLQTAFINYTNADVVNKTLINDKNTAMGTLSNYQGLVLPANDKTGRTSRYLR